MVSKRAEQFFKGPFNCAQAVLKTFEQSHNISSDEIEAMAKMGGGRAENGMCGALYAAKEIINSEHFEEIEKEFVSKAGSAKCRDIRKLGKLSCLECVAISAILADKITSPDNS